MYVCFIVTVGICFTSVSITVYNIALYLSLLLYLSNLHVPGIIWTTEVHVALNILHALKVYFQPVFIHLLCTATVGHSRVVLITLHCCFDECPFNMCLRSRCSWKEWIDFKFTFFRPHIF